MNDAYVTMAPKPKLRVKKTCPAAATHTLGLERYPRSGVHKKFKPSVRENFNIF